MKIALKCMYMWDILLHFAGVVPLFSLLSISANSSSLGTAMSVSKTIFQFASSGGGFMLSGVVFLLVVFLAESGHLSTCSYNAHRGVVLKLLLPSSYEACAYLGERLCGREIWLGRLFIKIKSGARRVVNGRG